MRGEPHAGLAHTRFGDAGLGDAGLGDAGLGDAGLGDAGQRGRRAAGTRPSDRAMSAMTVAVLGAGGSMGFPIARNLARAGHAVRAWNRTPEKAAMLTSECAELCGTPAEAARDADVVLTMLADTDAVLSAMGAGQGPALPAMNGSAVWLQMSTIGEQATQHCAGIAMSHGVGFVDAPVLGTRQPAEEARLVVLASGPQHLRFRVQPVFDAIGQRTIWVGEAGAGSRLKLVTNSWVLGVVECGAEAISLAEGLGLAPGLLLEAIEGGTLDLPYLRTKANAMARRDFEPAFKLALAAKDAALVTDAAATHGLDLPLLRAVCERLGEGAEHYPDQDFSATYLLSTARLA